MVWSHDTKNAFARSRSHWRKIQLSRHFFLVFDQSLIGMDTLWLNSTCYRGIQQSSVVLSDGLTYAGEITQLWGFKNNTGNSFHLAVTKAGYYSDLTIVHVSNTFMSHVCVIKELHQSILYHYTIVSTRVAVYTCWGARPMNVEGYSSFSNLLWTDSKVVWSSDPLH